MDRINLAALGRQAAHGAQLTSTCKRNLVMRHLRTALMLTIICVPLSAIAQSSSNGVYGGYVGSDAWTKSYMDAARHQATIRDRLGNHGQSSAAANPTPPANQAVVGEYVCRLMGNQPCDTHTMLRVNGDGSWGWSEYGGSFQARGNEIQFSGNGGPASWGTAYIGPGTITFPSSGGNVVWQK